MMSNGMIGWRELMSPEPEKSERFYGELFGWSIKAVPFGPMTYRLVNAGEKQIAGIMDFKKPGIPPHWVSYVTVADVDAAANACKANGGTVANAPTDIPDVGRFAVLLDPFGAVSVRVQERAPRARKLADGSPGPERVLLGDALDERRRQGGRVLHEGLPVDVEEGRPG